jgi:hypothetical protein
MLRSAGFTRQKVKIGQFKKTANPAEKPLPPSPAGLETLLIWPTGAA